MGQKQRDLWEVEDISIIKLKVENRTGILNQILGKFIEKEIGLTRIQSKPCKFKKNSSNVEFTINFTGDIKDQNVVDLLTSLQDMEGVN